MENILNNFPEPIPTTVLSDDSLSQPSLTNSPGTEITKKLYTKKKHHKEKKERFQIKQKLKVARQRSKERILPLCFRHHCILSPNKQKNSTHSTRKKGKEVIKSSTEEHGRLLLSPVSSSFFWDYDVYEDISSDSLFPDVDTLIKRAKLRDKQQITQAKIEPEIDTISHLLDTQDDCLSISSKEDEASICSETTVLQEPIKSAYSPALTPEHSNLCWNNWTKTEDEIGCYSPCPEYSPKYSELSDETVILNPIHFDKLSEELNFQDEENKRNTWVLDINTNNNKNRTNKDSEDTKSTSFHNSIEGYKMNYTYDTHNSVLKDYGSTNIKKEPGSPGGTCEPNTVLEGKTCLNHCIKLKTENDETEVGQFDNSKDNTSNNEYKIKSE